MSGLNFKITRNGLSPALRRLTVLAKNPDPLLRVVGNTLLRLTVGNFSAAGAGYRPRPWPSKRDGQPSYLQKSGALLHGFALEVAGNCVRISNPLIYASTHQFGATIRPRKKHALSWLEPGGHRVFAQAVRIPARPFFPVANGRLTLKAEAAIREVVEKELTRQVRTGR